MVRGLQLLYTLEQTIAYETGCVVTGLTLKQKEQQWTLILRVRDDKGINWVSFTDAHTIADCFDVVAEALHTTSVSLKWYKDRYNN